MALCPRSFGYFRIILTVLVTVQSSWARPIVRNIQSVNEFDRLLKKHAGETGLPVIVDFYSESCGPCRQMAPIFKKVAQSVMGKAVFVKVNTSTQQELSSRFQVRSLPTFMFFYGDSKKARSEAKGGIGEQNLRQRTDEIIRTSEIENVKIEYDNFVEYYNNVDPEKQETDIKTLYEKCSKMTKSKSCQGSSALQLARKLKKKYKSAPKTVKRFLPQEPKADDKDDEQSNDKKQSTKKNKSSSSSPSKPNLHLATKEQLMEELEKREEEERENEEDDDDELDEFGALYAPSDFPERVVIVGGGPAGLAAAVYAARAGLDPLVIAPSMGGQLQGKGVDVENYPGLHNYTGPAVVAAMRKQAAMFGTIFEDNIVTSVDASARPIRITLNNTFNEDGSIRKAMVIKTHTLIVATGAESKWLDVPGEYEMRGGGVSSCATCDGFLFSNKDVVVVGGGDTAMEDALVLARTSKSVTLVHRRDAFRASKILAERVQNHPLINVVWNTTLQEIVGQKVVVEEQSSESDNDEEEDLDLDSVVHQKIVSGAILQDVTTKETRKIDCDAVFIAIGHTPTTSFLEGVVEFDQAHPGYIKPIPSSSSFQSLSAHTSESGIFAAGDVADSIYRQAITSAGSGAAAALDAERYLSENGLGNEKEIFEAELLAELLGFGESMDDCASNKSKDCNDGGDEYYNVYASNEKIGVGVKESFAASSSRGGGASTNGKSEL